ncbi:MAG: glucose 1-dehydrogenase [Clostridiales bacterium]|nr:glucose 1-dehydrogenase [Clostridiales bacterium]
MDNQYSFNFQGKTVVVTGAERGIGLEIAKGFARSGANVAVAGMMEAEFDNASEEISKEGVKCLCIKTDVSNEDSVKNMISQVKNTFGRIDILVNNAGINKLYPAEKMPLEVWNSIIGVNLTGVFLVSREAANVMLEQGGGNIVNITSMSGLVVNPLPQTQCAYNSSKAGAIMLTKCMAVEWAERGIRVNGIAPGFMNTPLTKKRLTTPNDPAVKKWIEGTPLNRVGEPSELVGLALYLASDASSYTTGTVISVDGGYTCL